MTHHKFTVKQMGDCVWRYCDRTEFHEGVQYLPDLHISVSFSSKDNSILWGKLFWRKNVCDVNRSCFISGRLIIIF